MKEISAWAFCILWMAGFVIAKGFWSTFFCIIPFWSIYLVVEKVMIYYGVA
jgi:hypothetical protein